MTSAVALGRPEKSARSRSGRQVDLRRLILTVQFWVLGLLPLLSALTAPRYFEDGSTGVSSSAALVPSLQGPVTLLQGRGTLFVALVGAIAAVPTMKLDRRGSRLALGFSALWLAFVLAAVFAEQPSSVTVPLSVLLLGVTWYVAPPMNVAWLASQTRLLLRVYAVGSLVAAVALADWALEPQYRDSFLPGVTFRLHGLATHANYLAPILLFGLVVERLAPRAGITALLGTLAAWVALFLTQSKTTLLAAGAIVLVEAYRRTRHKPQGLRMAADVTALMAAVPLAAVVWTTSTRSHDSLNTFQARVDVWRVTLAYWRDNPLLGFGLNLWGPEMRLEYARALGWIVPHSHNQLIQTLGEAGIIGGLALVYYVVQLIRAGGEHAAATRGVSLAVVVLVVFESLTECPVARAGGDVFLSFAVYAVLLTIARDVTRPMPGLGRG